MDADAVPAPARWLDRLEDRLGRLGASWLRVYAEGGPGPLGTTFEVRGLRPRAETGYLGLLPGQPPPGVSLLAVTDDEHWQEKLRLHERSGSSSSLYQSPAADWVELERRKCESGAMRAFLVAVDAAVCGTVCAIPAPGVLRAKNLLLESHARGRGLAAAVLASLSGMAEREGAAGVGAFAVDGGAGDRLYRRTGFRALARQVEWTRRL